MTKCGEIIFFFSITWRLLIFIARKRSHYLYRKFCIERTADFRYTSRWLVQPPNFLQNALRFFVSFFFLFYKFVGFILFISA